MYARQQTEKLGYDAAGNRIRRETEQEITTYRYDNCNRLQELRREYKNTETSTAQPQIIRYTYDRQGNMLSEGEKKYSYDSFGRMVRAEVPVEHRGASNKPDEHAGFNHAAQSTGETFGTQENSSATREFQVQINRYDGEGLRHEMEENGRLIKFLYNEDREVVAEETSNGTITRYIRGLGLISSDSEEAKTYYHYVSDEQGSITHVLSEDAEILNHYNYDAFGNIIEKTEQVENRFCYNGEMLDSITQQYYLRARFYNPVIGRFTQEDTYYGDGLNLYQYCQANPLGYVDPSGHNCETTQSRYNSNEEQHPKANAADAYQSATEKGNSKSGSSSVDDVYDGVKKASEYLKQQGVPRKFRKQILESFDVRTIKLETAGENTYGLRFYGGNASAEGRYLFETFSPLTNRENLALPYEWNSMTGIRQFQVKSGTTMITGAAAPQLSFGGQYIGGANQWYINNLEDLIKCH